MKKLLFFSLLVFGPIFELYANNISVNFNQLPIKEAIKQITQSRVNVAFSEQVNGEVSLSFLDINWRNALTAVLKLKGLKKLELDDVWLILSANEYANLKTEHAELKSKSYTVKHSDAELLLSTLKQDDFQLLDSTTKLSLDARTNSLFITAPEHKLNQITRALSLLDVPVKQVLIEARMVTMRDNVDKQLGIRWGITDHNVPSAASQKVNGVLSNHPSNVATDITSRLNVNLPVAAPAGSIAFQLAKLSDSSMLDLELSAMERENQGEVVATPRIMATNNVTSRIEQGTEIPYLQSAAYGATSISFKKAVLSLEVTPHVLAQQDVVLDLNITQDARGESVMTSTGPAVAIDTQQIKTRVTVKSGETLVLGGIYQQQVMQSVNKVPWLGDLPYVGRLFRTSSNYQEKRELLIFVTPTIQGVSY